MISDSHAIGVIAVVTVVTAVLRFLPFLIFGGKRKTPGFVTYLAHVLPFAIIGMLVVYCLKDVTFFSGNHGIPEVICVILVVILHKWKHNSLLSIFVGTVVYMLLVQMVF